MITTAAAILPQASGQAQLTEAAPQQPSSEKPSAAPAKWNAPVLTKQVRNAVVQPQAGSYSMPLLLRMLLQTLCLQLLLLLLLLLLMLVLLCSRLCIFVNKCMRTVVCFSATAVREQRVCLLSAVLMSCIDNMTRAAQYYRT